MNGIFGKFWYELPGAIGGSDDSDGDKKETVGGVEVRDYPFGGLYYEGRNVYDLNSFNQFYNDFGNKFSATSASFGNGYVIFSDVSNLTIDGKPFKPYAEAESYLSYSFLDGGFYTKVSVGANTNPNRRGTSYSFNHVSSSDAFVPENALYNTTIHTHPPPGKHIQYYMGVFPDGFRTEMGPTYPNDYNSGPFRNVVVDPLYIYLINSNPDQNIIFRRPQ